MDVVLIYLLLDDTPSEYLSLKGEHFKYLVKVRRHSLGDKISFRSKKSMDTLYEYKIISIENRSLELKQISSQDKSVKAKKKLHIGWCIIDIKSIEKILASLSEIGVSKISFIHCDRSQNNFKLDFERFNRILQNSMQQSGRSTHIEFDSYENIQCFMREFPQTKIFDFTNKTVDAYSTLETVLIGCEGGFSQKEKYYLVDEDVFALDTPMVLRSESAVLAVASKILL